MRSEIYNAKKNNGINLYYGIWFKKISQQSAMSINKEEYEYYCIQK